MDIEKINWNNDSYKEFINYLKSLSDREYKKFHSNIANTKLEIMGVRVPILRKIAKSISKTNIEDYFKVVGDNYYEEVFINGIVLSLTSEELFSKYLVSFIDKIDNWAICDSFCSSLKFIDKKMGKYWIYFTSLLDQDKEFQTRCSINVFMDHYLNDQYIDRVLDIVTKIKSNYYYVNMAISWLLSDAFVKYSDKVIEILKEKKLGKFIQNKTISKINDSYRIDRELKEKVKKYRIK